eukprot:2797889-Rhodomonas_salina.3
MELATSRPRCTARPGRSTPPCQHIQPHEDLCRRSVELTTDQEEACWRLSRHQHTRFPHPLQHGFQRGLLLWLRLEHQRSVEVRHDLRLTELPECPHACSLRCARAAHAGSWFHKDMSALFSQMKIDVGTAEAGLMRASGCFPAGRPDTGCILHSPTQQRDDGKEQGSILVDLP